MYSAFVVLSTILILLLPVWIILLILKRSDRPSKWKYPPSKRITQFLFSLGNFLLAAFLILPYTMFFFLTLTSVWGLVIGLSIITLGIVSLVSLFRPAFTLGIIPIYIIIGATSHYTSPTRERPTTYRDICNELREDPYCEENDTGFTCTSPSENAGKILDKSICVNNTAGNSDHDFENSYSEYEGLRYTTLIPFLYIKNLPRNNCINRNCGYKVETMLEDFRNPCSNCLDSKRLTTRLRIEYVPIGTKLKVLTAFQIKNKVPGMNSSVHKILLIEDEFGTKSEISESSFEIRVVKGKRNWDLSLENEVLSDLSQIDKESLVIKNICFSSAVGKMDLVELRLKKFINDFRIEGDIQYLPFTEETKTQGKGIKHCSDITFKTKNSYLLGHYYFSEWGLWGW